MRDCKNMYEIEISRWLFELQPIQPIWQQFLSVLHVFAVPLSSKVGMKNVFKYGKDFLLYLTTLEKYCVEFVTKILTEV